jgi:hypothetical protein
VKQVINVSQIFAKKMIEENIKGAIVNVSSQVAKFCSVFMKMVEDQGSHRQSLLAGSVNLL